MEPKCMSCDDIYQTQPLLNSTKPKPEAENPGSSRGSQSHNRTYVVVSWYAFCLLLAVTISTRWIRTPVPHITQPKGEGISDKRFRVGSGSTSSYPWTNAMLAWQRTAFHFQPHKNWMNDPNGPLYHLGWYHIFYQYNPESAIWGNITWGHAVSRDLIHWLYLPLALLPDQPYDINGVWTGSATTLPDGNIAMLYTGHTTNSIQVQNLAYPSNLSDPLLLHWSKYESNPVMTPPPGIRPNDFRDPTTAWVGPDGVWRVGIGSKVNETTGVTLVYKTSDFRSFELVEDHALHAVPTTGMWECVDFYPLVLENKHVLKASLDDNRHDWYAIGTYDAESDVWTPDDPEADVGIGLRVDYGNYYASKTFYDQSKGRRVSWGWIGETDSEFADLDKGWASIQSLPRAVTLDAKTRRNILQWPVEEVEGLRSSKTEFKDVLLAPGSVMNLNISQGSQLDVSVEFVVDTNALTNSSIASSDDAISKCSPTTLRGALGPFGILVLSKESLSELTPVYFYIAKAADGKIVNWFCTDKSRSTKATDVDKEVYGGPVSVLEEEEYRMRVLVDHSVVEAFGQGGRTCITSRVYPTEANNGGATLFLFNNATRVKVVASVKVWHMSSAMLRPFPLHQLISHV